MPSIQPNQFRIAARSPSGAVRTLRISATDAPTAVRIAERDGLRVLSCEAGGRGMFSSFPQRRTLAPARLDIALFAHEMASLLDAGLGIVEAIETLAEKQRNSESDRILSLMVEKLEEGQSLSSVMAALDEVFPPLLIASVASSEQTGDMALALKRYATNSETLRALRSKALSAAVYPLMLLSVGILVVIFLLAVVVPRFAALIEASHSDIPFASRMLIEAGKGINAHPQFALALLAAAAIGLSAGIYRAASAGWNLSLIQRLPVVGRLVRMFRHAQFFRTSGMLVEGGITVARAFDMAGTLLSPDDRQKLNDAVASIREGTPIGLALERAALADAVALRMLTVAERTGQLAGILARISSFQELALAREIDVATRLFEPMLMLIIGLVIGAIVVLMYLPIFDLASTLQ